MLLQFPFLVVRGVELIRPTTPNKNPLERPQTQDYSPSSLSTETQKLTLQNTHIIQQRATSNTAHNHQINP